MVCILEGCGITCVSIAYITLIIANVAFINIVVVPKVQKEEPVSPWLLLGTYEALILLIIWAHLKTMFSEPGYIPKGYLKYRK
jgi:hypothetical protein